MSNNVFAWMAQQCLAASSPAVQALEKSAQRPDRYVMRTDGSMVTHTAYFEEMQHGVLAILQQHGSRSLADIRHLMSQGYFVGTKAIRQAAEISGALKALLKVGKVRRLGHMPYTWEAA